VLPFAQALTASPETAAFYARLRTALAEIDKEEALKDYGDEPEMEETMEATGINKAAEGLRAYADFLEAHPAFNVHSEVGYYNIGGAEVIKELIASSPEWEIEIMPAHDIVYIQRTFGELRVQHVISKSVMCAPEIADGKIVWALKPEFARLRPDADARARSIEEEIVDATLHA
jgi:hypothetical protein